jgi:hypothetical protein
MNVKQLKEILNTFNDNDLVVMASDEEGNSYHKFSGDIWKCKYYEEYCYIRELTPQLIENGYSEDDLCEDGVNAICLYP